MIFRKLNYFSILLMLVLFFCPTENSNAQLTNQTMIYNAYVSGDWNSWLKEIKTTEQKRIESVDQKIEIINLYYGYIGHLVSKKHYDEATKYILKGEILLDQILKSQPKQATALAYKGSFTGFKIPMNKLKVFSLGSESTEYLNGAYEFDNDNIQAVIDKGSALFFKPKIFGGNKPEALKLFIKATKLYEINKITTDNWMYLNVLTLVARAYEKTGQLNNAKIVYEKILRIEPEFKWVQSELYPELLAKMKN
ncbi:MAG: hypothetical protein Q7U47_09730 [Paludibacter sp.]|nr:hypothetical protein [Paludibacter sp.]